MWSFLGLILANFFRFFFYHLIKFPIEFLVIYCGFLEKQIHLTTCTSILVREMWSNGGGSFKRV